jgi:Na+-translocating ferredoxin:NAD+ oxidoreductase subunit B
MAEEVYASLASALDALPNGFPRTPGGSELRILEIIFSPEEASLAAQLGRVTESTQDIAVRLGLDAKTVAARLKSMAKKGQVWPDFDRTAGERRYRLAPFVVGVYEASLELMNHELAHLVDRYLAEGGAAGIMGAGPALHRALPAHGAAEWILPYDDIVQMIEQAETFHIDDCICRAQQAQLGKECKFPLHSCLVFSNRKRAARPDDVSKAQALALLAETERLGLVHTVSNTIADHFYVCNCCGCCCALLRSINEQGLLGAVARTSYKVVLDPEACTGCGTCGERCQVRAMSVPEGLAVVDESRCLGCGVCVTGCPTGALRLERLPDAEIIHPPADFAAWEEERLHRSAATHEHNH